MSHMSVAFFFANRGDISNLGKERGWHNINMMALGYEEYLRAKFYAFSMILIRLGDLTVSDIVSK